MSVEDPETYLRRFAETQLRRLAAGEVTAAECAAHVDSVAVAFEETGALDGQVTSHVTEHLHVALMARATSPGSGPMGRSALRGRPGFADLFARQRSRTQVPEGPTGEVSVVPATAALHLRKDDGDEDIYLLGYTTVPGRAWLSVAARTSQPLVPRRHASPPSARNPRALQSNRYRPTFAGGGIVAIDDTGRGYTLGFAGGGGDWYIGRLTLNPVPASGTAWLEVRCGGESVRLDLRAKSPAADVTVQSLAGTPGENYLRRQAESLIGSPESAEGPLRARATGLSDAVPALRAVGLLPPDSPVPGEVAALFESLGGPGELIAVPGRSPAQWVAGRDSEFPPQTSVTVAAGSLAVALPEADGVAVHLTAVLTRPDAGTWIFGGIRMTADSGEPAFWLRDDTNSWHSVSVRGMSGQGGDYAFQAAVVPPLTPETSQVELHVTGKTTEVRATIPVRWWLS
ncbi:MAG: hypothetical protein FWE35_03135 [Streptosporangiales bacterium]|jgi:hypothetical protein|nr:hypothetical protein [Streptosporangiales bacterium]